MLFGVEEKGSFRENSIFYPQGYYQSSPDTDYDGNSAVVPVERNKFAKNEHHDYASQIRETVVAILLFICRNCASLVSLGALTSQEISLSIAHEVAH